MNVEGDAAEPGPGDITLQTYQAAADHYAERTPRRPTADPFVDRVLVLETAGWSIDHLEHRQRREPVLFIIARAKPALRRS